MWIVLNKTFVWKEKELTNQPTNQDPWVHEIVTVPGDGKALGLLSFWLYLAFVWAWTVFMPTRPSFSHSWNCSAMRPLSLWPLFISRGLFYPTGKEDRLSLRHVLESWLPHVLASWLWGRNVSSLHIHHILCGYVGGLPGIPGTSHVAWIFINDTGYFVRDIWWISRRNVFSTY